MILWEVFKFLIEVIVIKWIIICGWLKYLRFYVKKEIIFNIVVFLNIFKCDVLICLIVLNVFVILLIFVKVIIGINISVINII